MCVREGETTEFYFYPMNGSSEFSGKFVSVRYAAFPHAAIPLLSRNNLDICFCVHKHPICPSFPFFYNIPLPKLIQNGKTTKLI